MYIPTIVCNKCCTIKPLTVFYQDKSKYDGYQSQCKNCNKLEEKNIIMKIKMIF